MYLVFPHMPGNAHCRPFSSLLLCPFSYVRHLSSASISLCLWRKAALQNLHTQTILAYWCFEPSQPLWIISGLKETFTKRYRVRRTNKAEIRPEEQSQKTESCQENWWDKIQLKVPNRQKQTQEQNKKTWASLVGLSQTKTVTSPPHESKPARTTCRQQWPT